MTQPSSLHVVVLAAGVGSRLSGTQSRPKWLTPVGATTIADEQLAGVDALAHEVQLDVVTGHLAPQVEARVQGRAGSATVHNERHIELNNWWSVLVALQHRARTGRRGGMVVLNSDLWAPASWFTQAIQALVEQPRAALVVDTQRPLTDEAMKVSAHQGLATAIGKVGVDDPVGEYTGALWVPEADLPVFEKALSSFVDDPDRNNAWYEHAVDVTFGLGLPWALVEAPSTSWVEIDDDRDLKAAVGYAAGQP